MNRSTPSEVVSWTGIMGHILLAIFKGLAGYFAGSKALMTDGLYSASNAAASLSERISWQPFRQKKHLSHIDRTGETKPIVGILISVVLLTLGLQLITSAVKGFSAYESDVNVEYAFIALIISLAINEAIFQFQYRQSIKQGDGKHKSYVENHRFSLYSSLTVLVGMSLVMLGDFMNWPALLYMDHIAMLLIAGLIIRKGYLLIVRSVSSRLNQEVQKEETATFIETVQRVRGVITVDELKAHEHGHYVSIDVQISVNPRITMLEAHDISECAKNLLMHRFLHVSEVRIKAVPYDPGYPYKSNYEIADDDMTTLLQ